MLDCRAKDEDIKTHAQWSAGRVRTVLATVAHHFRPHVNPTNYSVDTELDRIAFENGIEPAQAKTEQGKRARMICPKWWRRRLRTSTLRSNENKEHAAGLIRKKAQVYVTDHAVKTKMERAKINTATLDGLEVVNELGEVFNLGEVVKKSVSNPAIRRGELMTRCRGFEEAAEFMGHTGYFLTLTCPSRFHRVNFAGIENKKWNGETVKDGQIYLCAIWAKIRTAWKKKGYAPYGFRVAEPHHDGCPHWHLLLFFDASHAADLLAIAKDYALQDSPNESGAQKRRFTVKRIDPAQGSATGYIAKYICKNIDGTKETGEKMGLDFASGSPAEIAAVRVKTWATLHGIRQFQQIGGPSVTVWRELRKLDQEAGTCQLELFEKPRAAASRGDWFSFWMVQGGPDVARKDLSVKPFYVTEDTGAYGDLMKKIKGVSNQDETQQEPTRLHEWTVQKDGMAAVNWFQDHRVFMKAYEDAEFKRIREANQARTGVNNCSEPQTFDFSHFEPEPPFMPETFTGFVSWLTPDCLDPDEIKAEIDIDFAEMQKMERIFSQHRACELETPLMK